MSMLKKNEFFTHVFCIRNYVLYLTKMLPQIHKRSLKFCKC